VLLAEQTESAPDRLNRGLAGHLAGLFDDDEPRRPRAKPSGARSPGDAAPAMGADRLQGRLE
jgi:hypothetical protein